MDMWTAAITGAVAKLRPAVVHVSAQDHKENTLTLGTGVVLDNYHIVSNAQVVGQEDEITVTTADGKKYEGTCVGIDPLYFLAVVRVDGRLPTGSPVIADPDEIPAGQVCVAIGNAFGEHNVSTGVVSAPDRTIYRPERFAVDGLMITDARIHPGNTGGPLGDLDGRWLGLNGVPWVHGLGLAVQAVVAARVANQIIEYGQATHPWLGFSGDAEVVDQTIVQLLGLPVDRGLVVSYVADDGPGVRAGVQTMDMVVRAGDRPVSTVGAVRKILSLHRPGEKVPLTVLRGMDLITVEIKVEEIPRLYEANQGEPN